MSGTETLTLTDFLMARITEDEAQARDIHAHRCETPSGVELDTMGRPVTPVCDCDWHVARVLAECEAKRRIVEWHENWPVLAQQQPKYEPVDGTDPGHYTFRASQQLAWLTEQEYRTRFGDEPPTSPILRMMATVYADHEDYRDEWRP